MVKELYESLLAQRFVDRKGAEKPMGAENILVVAPYNMQVNLLKRVLPAGARVGTVDKFQGQEAEAVIISMATSSGEYLPRNIEFLYSKNRFNVAVSRARSLAVLVASPKLLEVELRDAGADGAGEYDVLVRGGGDAVGAERLKSGNAYLESGRFALFAIRE